MIRALRTGAYALYAVGVFAWLVVLYLHEIWEAEGRG